MEFGRVPEEELNSIDFSLPKEPAANKAVLGGKVNTASRKCISAVQNGEEQNGLAKSTRQRQKGKRFPRSLCTALQQH